MCDVECVCFDCDVECVFGVVCCVDLWVCDCIECVCVVCVYWYVVVDYVWVGECIVVFGCVVWVEWYVVVDCFVVCYVDCVVVVGGDYWCIGVD